VKVELLEQYGNWRNVADAARTTCGQDAGEGEPSSKWKTKILLAQHSPIRLIFIRWKWYNLPYWVSVHFVRHHEGIDHFVRSQRSDRTGIDRNELRQDEPVTHECCANMQAILNISEKRLCNLASKETTNAWERVIEAIKEKHPELAALCVKPCQRTGICEEMKPCGIFTSRGNN